MAIKPVAPYVGGKRRLAQKIIERIDGIAHDTYAEAFVGMGGVFFRRATAPKAEVINDFSGEIANLFRILQRHYVSFVQELQWKITSRKEFERLSNCDPTTLTDLERAARFLYLQRTVFGGKVAGGGFGVSLDRPARFNLMTLAPMLEAAHERLSGVVIEQLSYQDFIPRYDRPKTLFYLDPPYWGTENYYGKELFVRDDFERLAKITREIKGRFVLSINDRPQIRKLFDGFKMAEVEVLYTVSQQGNSKRAAELIIWN